MENVPYLATENKICTEDVMRHFVHITCKILRRLFLRICTDRFIDKLEMTTIKCVFKLGVGITGFRILCVIFIPFQPKNIFCCMIKCLIVHDISFCCIFAPKQQIFPCSFLCYNPSINGDHWTLFEHLWIFW